MSKSIYTRFSTIAAVVVCSAFMMGTAQAGARHHSSGCGCNTATGTNETHSQGGGTVYTNSRHNNAIVDAGGTVDISSKSTSKGNGSASAGGSGDAAGLAIKYSDSCGCNEVSRMGGGYGGGTNLSVAAGLASGSSYTTAGSNN